MLTRISRDSYLEVLINALVPAIIIHYIYNEGRDRIGNVSLLSLKEFSLNGSRPIPCLQWDGSGYTRLREWFKAYIDHTYSQEGIKGYINMYV